MNHNYSENLIRHIRPAGERYVLTYPGRAAEHFLRYESAVEQARLYWDADRESYQKAKGVFEREQAARSAGVPFSPYWVGVDLASGPDYTVTLAKVPFEDVDEVVDAAQAKGWQPTYKWIEKPSPEGVYAAEIRDAELAYRTRYREAFHGYNRLYRDVDTRQLRPRRIDLARAQLREDEREALARYKIAVLKQAGL